MNEMKLTDLAAEAFELRERVKMLEMMNTPANYDDRKKAFIALQIARQKALEAEILLENHPQSQHQKPRPQQPKQELVADIP